MRFSFTICPPPGVSAQQLITLMIGKTVPLSGAGRALGDCEVVRASEDEHDSRHVRVTVEADEGAATSVMELTSADLAGYSISG